MPSDKSDTVLPLPGTIARVTLETTDFDWTGVRDRVLSLRTKRRAKKLFGASGLFGHGFAVADPLSEAEVVAVETRFGVELPADYRRFLLEVSAGGAGPHYGLALLSRDAEGDWNWDCGAADAAVPARTAEPFGGEAALAAAHAVLDAHEALEPRRDDYDAEGYAAAREQWRVEDDALFDRHFPPPGLIALSHHGCGYLDWLVVAGPERGGMWVDGDGGGTGTGLERLLGADGRHLSFSQWYLTWLRAAEAA